MLAVPDTVIGKVATQLSPKLKAGTIVVILDAAAPYAGHLPDRPDLTYFVTHPCHPPIFNDETDMVAKKDHFGGVAAKQHIVNALMQGPEEHYALGEEVARTIWKPVMRSHRVTVEQIALLEPGLSETVCATLLDVMREAMDEVVARGVPAEAARDFLLGHLNILGGGDLQGTRGRVLGRLQQGHRVRQAGADAARLEARLRAGRNRREHPSHHLKARYRRARPVGTVEQTKP